MTALKSRMCFLDAFGYCIEAGQTSTVREKETATRYVPRLPHLQLDRLARLADQLL